MSEKSRLTLSVVIVVAALGAFAYWSVTRTKSVRHIPGATRIVFEPTTQATNDQLDVMARGLGARAQGIPGVGDTSVGREGTDRIVVEIAGPVDEQKAAKWLLNPASLEFYYLKNVKSKRNPSAPWEMMEVERDFRTNEDIYSFRNQATGKIIRGDTPAGQKQVLKEVLNAYDPITNPKGERPLLTTSDLMPNAKGDLPASGQPEVLLQFNEKGSAIFLYFTQRHVSDIVAVVLNGRIVTAPTIREPIPNGRASISGGFKSVQDAVRCADSLNAGALPMELRVVKEK